MKRYLIIASGIISVIYLLNPTAGLIEIIPDNIPIIGNLDEGAAAYIIISVIAYLRGKDFGLFSNSNEQAKSEIDNREKSASNDDLTL
jgi:uncharacterized membrane protein YkvA (DUF1232 family)